MKIKLLKHFIFADLIDIFVINGTCIWKGGKFVELIGW
jgi:hypothetical protein